MPGGSRLAYADLLQEADRATLIILDDSLVHSDENAPRPDETCTLRRRPASPDIAFHLPSGKLAGSRHAGAGFADTEAIVQTGKPPMTPLEALRPEHIVAGIGSAEREMLATCLALFDDAKLLRLVKQKLGEAVDKLRRRSSTELEDIAASVRSAQANWMASSHTDATLRAMLWIRLREAFQLPPALSGSVYGARRLADDLSAAVIGVQAPATGLKERGRQWLEQKGWKTPGDTGPQFTLQQVVQPVIDDLLEAAFKSVEEAPDSDESRDFIQQAVDAMNALDERQQEELRQRLGVDELNAQAIRRVLATGGGLAALGTSVSLAGFSAYILAAQASAFIPLVSGPGLVSFLHVLVDPITFFIATLGTGWWAGSSAERKIQAVLGVRIAAMLAVRGLAAREQGFYGALKAFSRVPRLQAQGFLSEKLLECYRGAWANATVPATAEYATNPADLWPAMQQPVLMPQSQTTADGAASATAVGAMTVGQMLYSAYSIDPAAIDAAQFTYLADISGPVDFAQLGLHESAGAAVRLKGYVAEQVVAARLQAQGHSVIFPEDANQEGFDLIVDGQATQVKFRADLGGIREHFKVYDYPLIANTEFIGKIPEEYADKVFFVDGVSLESVNEITRQSVAAAENLASPDIPAFALAYATWRSAEGLWRGELSPQQAVEQLLLDGSVRVGLALSGQVVGASVGAILFGPAGAWVMGAGLPVVAQSQSFRVVAGVRQQMLLPEARRWAGQGHDALDALVAAGQRALAAKAEHLARLDAAAPEGQAGDYFHHCNVDRKAFIEECRAVGNILTREYHIDPRQRLTEILRWLGASEIHPIAYQSQLQAVITQIKQRPSLLDEWQGDTVQSTLAGVREASGRYGAEALNQSRELGRKLSRWWRDSDTPQDPQAGA